MSQESRKGVKTSKAVVAMLVVLASAAVTTSCARGLPFAKRCPGGSAEPISLSKATHLLSRYGVGSDPIGCNTSDTKAVMVFRNESDDPVCVLYPKPRLGAGFAIQRMEYFTRVVNGNLECRFSGSPPIRERYKSPLIRALRLPMT